MSIDHPLEKHLVSLIVPVHNVAVTLDDTLASIAQQEHRDFEVILIDDGSTDGSADICRRWVARDPRFRAFHTPNRGSSAARNAGLDDAHGNFIAFVDSDDVLAPQFLTTLLRLMTEHTADIALCDYRAFAGDAPRYAGRPATTVVASAKDTLAQIVCVKPQWEVWGKLYRRKVWDGISFPEGLIHQDLAVIPQVFAAADTAVMTNAELYGYRNRTGSIMDTVRRKGPSADLLSVLSANIEFARLNSQSADEFKDFLATYALHASKQLEQMQHPRDSKNSAYLQGYRVFTRRYRRDVLNCGKISSLYRGLWLISSVSPSTFVYVFRLARSLKKGLLPGLRRGAERQSIPATANARR